jgi:Leucine-rich repeat (LRR) protein
MQRSGGIGDRRGGGIWEDRTKTSLEDSSGWSTQLNRRRAGGRWLVGAITVLAVVAGAGAQEQACSEAPVTIAQPGGTCVLKRACGMLSSVGDCSSVTTLLLRHKAISGLQVDVFAGMTALETLDLGWNALASLPDGVFSGLAKLKRLYLFQNKLEKLEDDIFAGLNLERLSLAGNSITYMKSSVFTTLEEWLRR